jgi:dTDP-4-amino-4,6-dideoxygalactose transaminase
VTALALLGGDAAFPERVPFVRPPAPDLDRVVEILRPSWDVGMLTNGPLVRELEARAAEVLDVEHVVAVSSCTTGLMLALRALGVTGEVFMPSFTFSASAHAVAWNGATPRFVECRTDTFQLDLDDLREDIGARNDIDAGGAILATHVFGAPCDPQAVVALAAERGLPVVFDAAHGFGARAAGIPLGRFGAAEVFSLTPTKPLVAGEGGLVATTRADIAELVRIGRDYANPGDYDTRFVGLNGRLSEMHAAVALASLEGYDKNQVRRMEVVERYREALSGIPGVRMQHVTPGDESTYKDLTIAVDASDYGVDRDTLRRALSAEGVDTRMYFDPPVHRQTAYHGVAGRPLPVTDGVSASVLSLPSYPGLSGELVDGIAALIAQVHERANDLNRRGASMEG